MYCNTDCIAIHVPALVMTVVKVQQLMIKKSNKQTHISIETNKVCVFDDRKSLRLSSEGPGPYQTLTEEAHCGQTLINNEHLNSHHSESDRVKTIMHFCSSHHATISVYSIRFHIDT